MRPSQASGAFGGRSCLLRTATAFLATQLRTEVNWRRAGEVYGYGTTAIASVE